MDRQPFQILVVWVTYCHQSLTLVKALILGYFKGLRLDVLLHFLVLGKLVYDLLAASLSDLLLAARAA